VASAGDADENSGNSGLDIFFKILAVKLQYRAMDE